MEQEDTREKVDIVKLNAEISEIVAREQVLRDEIDKIIAEIDLPAARLSDGQGEQGIEHMSSKWYTYVILCDDGSLYKGGIQIA